MLKRLLDKIRKAFKVLIDDDWHATYFESNMNHGQGPLKEDKTNDTYSN